MNQTIQTIIYYRCLPWLDRRNVFLVPLGNIGGTRARYFSPKQWATMIQKRRDQTLFDIDKIQRLLPLVREHLRAQKRYLYQKSSFTLQEVFEELLEEYVYNGEIILAMMLAGFMPKFTRGRQKKLGINAYFKARVGIYS